MRSRFGKRLAGAHPASLEPAPRQWSRALGPGSRRAAALATALAAAGAVTAGVLAGQSGSSGDAAALRYGQIPSWLPKQKVAVGRVLDASAAHPSLAIEGDTVSVHLAGGHVLATAVGPAIVGDDDRSPADSGGPDTVACTFSVTLASATGTVPLSAGAFSLIDEGVIEPARVTTATGGALPRRLQPGHTITLTVRATLSEGGGLLRWAPQGRGAIVAWDWGLETD